jgi:hypothetical protein
MYIPRSAALKMKIVNEKRFNAGFLSYATFKWNLINAENLRDEYAEMDMYDDDMTDEEFIKELDKKWCEANQDFIQEGKDVDTQNSKIILTKAQAAQYKLEMDEDWPYGVSND